MVFEVQCLPARQGDAIWVRWGEGRQLIVDMGTEQTGHRLAERLRTLPEDRRTFDLLVITHVDSDHIGDVLTCVSDPDAEVPGLVFRDVWFNGWEHLHGRQTPADRAGPGLEGMGPAQGERLAGWLRAQPWNEAFDRFPVVRGTDTLRQISLPDGLTVTVLGPTQARLDALRDTWRDEVQLALAKGALEEVSPGLRPAGAGALETFGSSTPPTLESSLSASRATLPGRSRSAARDNVVLRPAASGYGTPLPESWESARSNLRRGVVRGMLPCSTL